MLDDDTIIHYINMIRSVKEVQAMCHKNTCPPCQGTGENAVFEDGLANICVQCTQRIIE